MSFATSTGMLRTSAAVALLPVGARIMDGDAPIGGAGGIGRMIGVAAFVREHAFERLVVRRCSHCQSSCCECLQSEWLPRCKLRSAPADGQAETTKPPAGGLWRCVTFATLEADLNRIAEQRL